MSIAQGYVYCGCLTAAVVGVALLMIFMGIFRKGGGADLDDAGARLLTTVGVGMLVVLALIWAIGLSDKIH